MAEINDGDDLPQATVIPRKQRRISIVWIIPILAAVVALGIGAAQPVHSPDVTTSSKSWAH